MCFDSAVGTKTIPALLKPFVANTFLRNPVDSDVSCFPGTTIPLNLTAMDYQEVVLRNRNQRLEYYSKTGKEEIKLVQRNVLKLFVLK